MHTVPTASDDPNPRAELQPEPQFGVIVAAQIKSLIYQGCWGEPRTNLVLSIAVVGRRFVPLFPFSRLTKSQQQTVHQDLIK